MLNFRKSKYRSNVSNENLVSRVGKKVTECKFDNIFILMTCLNII